MEPPLTGRLFSFKQYWCIDHLMTKKQISGALERVKSWPDDRQADVVRIIQAIEAAGTGVYVQSDEEEAAVIEGLAEADRGDFVADDEMAKFWNRNRA
jgi:predicted transcriptional regulator